MVESLVNHSSYSTKAKTGRLPHLKGRPKTKNFSKWLNRWLSARDIETNIPRIEKIVERLAFTDPAVLLHYAYGKPLEQVQLQNPDGSGLFDAIIEAARLKIAESNQPKQLKQIEPAAILNDINTVHELDSGGVVKESDNV